MRRSLNPPPSLDEIAARIGATLQGSPTVTVDRLTSLRSADARSISFLVRPQQRDAALASAAAAIIVSPALADGLVGKANLLLHPSPYQAYAQLAQWFDQRVNPRPAPGLAAGAVVAPDAQVSPEAIVEAGAVIGARSIIAAHAWIGAHCVIGADCQVGEGTRLHPSVKLLDDCRVGARTIIHSGTVIGADGFGFAPRKGGGWDKIPQLGGVVIGNDVEIGANCCIDRGALDDTVIEDGVKLDNLIQIAHNVQVGDDTIMAGHSGIAGSSHVGRRVMVGGQAGIAGHLVVGDDIVVSAGTIVTKSLDKPGVYTAMLPQMPHADWVRNFAHLRRLDAMADRLRELEKKLADKKEKS